MYCVVIVPKKFIAADYLSTNTIKEIRPLRLAHYEIQLEEFCKSATKVYKSFERKLSKKLNSKIQENFIKYKWECTTDSFNALINELELSLKEMQNSINKMENERPETVNNKVNLENSIAYNFIDCIYCVVNKEQTKDFNRIVDSKTIKLINKDDNKALYEVFCLKANSQELKEALIKCKIEIRDTKSELENQVEKSEIEPEKLEIYEKLMNLIITGSIAKGLAEELNKFCFTSEFKYKIISGAKEEEEIGLLKKQNKLKELNDTVSVTYLDF